MTSYFCGNLSVGCWCCRTLSTPLCMLQWDVDVVEHCPHHCVCYSGLLMLLNTVHTTMYVTVGCWCCWTLPTPLCMLQWDVDEHHPHHCVCYSGLLMLLNIAHTTVYVKVDSHVDAVEHCPLHCVRYSLQPCWCCWTLPTPVCMLKLTAMLMLLNTAHSTVYVKVDSHVDAVEHCPLHCVCYSWQPCCATWLTWQLLDMTCCQMVLLKNYVNFLTAIRMMLT